MEKINKKRASKRLPYKNEIEIIGNGGEYCKGNIINISQTGICITTDSQLPVGAQILSRISIGSDTCELDGKIAWTSMNPKGDKFRMGVELEKIPDDFNEIYQKIIKKFSVPEKDKPSLLENTVIHKV
jgi:hypothetical protein